MYRLYVYGHELDPRAAVTVDPFMPAVFGTKQIANFTTHSFPSRGTYYIAAFAVGVAVLTIWHLLAARRRAQQGKRWTPTSDAPTAG